MTIADKSVDLTAQIEQAGEDAAAHMQADVDAGKTTWKQIGRQRGEVQRGCGGGGEQWRGVRECKKAALSVWGIRRGLCHRRRFSGHGLDRWPGLASHRGSDARSAERPGHMAPRWVSTTTASHFATLDYYGLD